MRKIILRSAYGYDTDAVSRETATAPGGESLAHQSFRDESDINTIVRRFGVTGQLPQNVDPPTYASFDGIFDFHTAMNAVAAAREAFGSMSSKVRARFHNNPQEFVEFCSDEKNLDEMRKMGLAIPAKVPDNVPAPDVPASGGSNVSGSGSAAS